MPEFRLSRPIRLALNALATMNAPSGFTYGTAPPPPPPPPPSDPADFVSRRTMPEVIAWQGFDSQAEVDKFARTRDTNLQPVPLYRESDSVVGSAMVFKFLGATLTADFLASGGNGPRTLSANGISSWPTSFPYRVFLSKIPDVGATFKTLLEVSAISGETATVTRIPLNTSEFGNATFTQDYTIGDAVGGECQNWTRPFTALTALDNGKVAADPAASGALPVRSRIVGNPSYVPQTTGLMGYGFTGHIDYHTDPRFSPWTPSSQIPTQGDSVTRTGVFDTTEIWFQARMWLSPDTQLTNMVGGKVMGIQAETTVPQQIVMGIGPGTAFTIPSTPNTVPLSLSKFAFGSYGSAGLALTANPYDANGSSYQPNSFDPVTGKSWSTTAIYAASGLPSTGQNTPDGSSAWEFKLGRWVTFLWHVKPGKAWHYQVDNLTAWNSATQTTVTLIDAPDEWPTSSFQVQAVEGTSTVIGTFDVASRSGATLSGITLSSGSHVNWSAIYGSLRKIPATPAGGGALSSEIEVYVADIDDAQYKRLIRVTGYPIVYGSNGQYANYWNQSVPGFNAMDFWGYHNSELSQANAPIKTYVQKAAQLIISRAYIPPPKPVWMGFTPPASGTIGALGSHTLYSIVTDVNERFSLSKVLGAWGSAAVVRIRDSDGLLIDLLYCIFGGGHGDTGNDAVYAWRSSTGQFERLLAASAQVQARLYLPAPANSFGEEPGGTVGRPASVHAYQTNQALDSGEGLGPAFLNTRALAVGQAAPATGQAHILDVDAVPPVWSRYGAMQPFNASTGWVVTVKDKSRRKFFMFENDNGTRFLECDYTSLTPTWVERNQNPRSTNNWGGSSLSCGVWDSVRDIYLATGGTTGLVGLNATTPTGSWVQLTVSGGPGTAVQGSKIWHRRKDDTFLLVDASTNPPTGLYVITPPTTWNSGTWTFVRRSFTGVSTYANAAGPWNDYERFQYIEELDVILVCPRDNAPMECWTL